MNHFTSKSRSRRRSSGYTLLELVVASASAAVLIGGLSSSLYIASQSLNVGKEGTLVEIRTANTALATINRDLQLALTLSELTTSDPDAIPQPDPTSVTMSVPDRNGDSVPETIRYYWAGTAGDPLTQVYNGGTATTLAANVQSFSLVWMTRFIEGVSSPPKILFVSEQPSDGDDGLGTPTAAEQLRIDLMDGWGFDVTVISQQATQTQMNDALALANVVYVSGMISPGTLGSKLNAATIGVVTESFYHADELGFYNGNTPLAYGTTGIDITDTSHYITSGFATGLLTVTTSIQNMKGTNTSYAADATKLANVDPALNYPTFLVLDLDDNLTGGGTAAARRCQLPWGENGFDVTALNTDGQTIMQRAIEWVGGTAPGTTKPLLMLVDDANNPTAEETARQSLIETWYYTVSLATASEPQSVYGTYPDNFDVVYVPSSVSYTDVQSKLQLLSIGVVNEVPGLSSYLGFTSGSNSFFGSVTNITDNTHDITSPFSTGNLTITSSSESLRRFNNTMGPGLHTLSTRPSYSDPMIMTLNTGDELLLGGNAPDRRVMLPWGSSSSFNVNNLNDDGKTLMQRAIDWADGDDDSNSLIGHWMLDETSGTTAADSSGNGHDGTHENGSTPGVTGKIGMGARFDGINDRVRIPDDPAFSSHTTTGLTASAWVKVHAFDTDSNSPPRQPIVSKGNWSDDWEWALYVHDDGTAGFITWQAVGFHHASVVGGSVQVGQWVHVTGTHEPGVADRLYVNGVEVNSDTTFVGSTHDGTRDVFIAAREDGQYLNATIDDVRIYDRALSATEIADLFAEAPASSGVIFEEFTEAQQASNTTSITLAVPPGTADGNLLIAAVATDGNQSGSLSPPADWNEIVVAAGDSSTTLGVWWKLATSSESSSYDFSWAGSEKAYGWIMRFTGHDPTNPINAAATAEGTSSSPIAPAVTTTVDGCLVLRIGGFDDDDITIGDAGMTGHTTITAGESSASSTSASGAAAYQRQTTAGDSGTANFTLTASEQHRTVTISIAPAP